MTHARHCVAGLMKRDRQGDAHAAAEMSEFLIGLGGQGE